MTCFSGLCTVFGCSDADLFPRKRDGFPPPTKYRPGDGRVSAFGVNRHLVCALPQMRKPAAAQQEEELRQVPPSLAAWRTFQITNQTWCVLTVASRCVLMSAACF